MAITQPVVRACLALVSLLACGGDSDSGSPSGGSAAGGSATSGAGGTNTAGASAGAAGSSAGAPGVGGATTSSCYQAQNFYCDQETHAVPDALAKYNKQCVSETLKNGKVFPSCPTENRIGCCTVAYPDSPIQAVVQCHYVGSQTPEDKLKNACELALKGTWGK